MRRTGRGLQCGQQWFFAPKRALAAQPAQVAQVFLEATTDPSLAVSIEAKAERPPEGHPLRRLPASLGARQHQCVLPLPALPPSGATLFFWALIQLML